MLPETSLIEIDLIDGGALDCVPHQLQYVEAFDTLKNAAFPDAAAFVLFQSDRLGQLLTSTSYEDIKAGIEASGNPDFLELTTSDGNRVIIRKSLVTSRATAPEGEGSLLTMALGGQYRTTALAMPLVELREAMKAQLAPPMGLEILPPPEPLPEPEPAPE